MVKLSGEKSASVADSTPGNVSEFGYELPVERNALSPRVAGRSEIVGSKQYIVRIESRILLLCLLQAANKEAGTDQ